jgi:hypothetical protein
MTDESAPATTSSTDANAATESSTASPIELPGNIDFTLNAAFTKMVYDVNELTNVKGGIILRNKVAYLNNLFMNVLDGSVTMSGKYDGQDLSLPKMDFVFDIKDMDINKSAKQFNTIDKLAPVAKACTGRFSTKFNLKSNLDQSMMPINPTVNGMGTLATKNVVIKDFAPLVKLADKINFDKLKQPQNISDVNVSFKIKDGVVNVDPFTVKVVDGIPMKVSGYTTLDQQINYNVDMDVPFDKFPSGAVNQANTWIGELNKKLGSNLSVGSKVNVIAVITGTVTDPKVGVTSKALGADAVAGLKEQALQEVAAQVTNLKNEALEKAIAEKERLVNEAKAARDKALVQAAATRDNAKKQAEAAAEKARLEAHKAADDQLAKVKNPLEKAAARLIADKAKKVADETKTKAVNKANKEADEAYVLAEKNANKLVTDAEARGDKAIQDASAKGDQQINKIK